MSETTRLVDMQVEEVSLVDRAANKQRFLLVKRDDTMTIMKNDQGTEGEENVDKGASENAEASSSSEDETNKAEGDMPAGGEGDGEGDSVLGSAVSALEVLTSLVESLGELGQSEEANGRLRELAGSLVEIGQAILGQVGAPAEAPPAEPPPADGEAAKSATNEAIDQAKALVEKLEKALSGRQVAQPVAQIDAGAISKIEASFKKFGDVLIDVQTRVTKMEKSVGLPASISPEESIKKNAPTEVVWPLDINAPTQSRENA